MGVNFYDLGHAYVLGHAETKATFQGEFDEQERTVDYLDGNNIAPRFLVFRCGFLF